MGLFSRFRRRKGAPRGGGSGPEPVLEYEGPVFEDPDPADPGVGGPAYYEAEIAKMRWIAEAEATNLARADIDPLAWRGGEMAFDHERGIAHAHEALRDKLASRVADQLAENASLLYEKAADVAVAREKLRNADNALVRVTRDFKKLYEDIRHDPLELGRYYRLTSKPTQDAKKVIAIVFVVSEFIISGFVFERMIPSEIPFLGYFFALGLMLLLIVVPHYTAQGLKEGVTRYHKFDQRWAKDNHRKVHPDLARRVDYEEMDDKGFRVAAIVVGIVLIALILPMSILRAHEIPTTIPRILLFFFFLLLQLGISGYFFLREWLDHGMASHNLYKLAEQKTELEYDRMAIYDNDYSFAVQGFHQQAEDLIFVLTQAPRWDSYIVQECMATIRLFRHHVMLGHHDLAPFITWARVPYLGSRQSVEAGRADGYPIDPLSNEHVALDEETLLGREWWMRAASDALARLPEPKLPSGGSDAGPEIEGQLPPSNLAAPSSVDDVSWYLSRSPWVLLREFLQRYFDLDVNYVRPAELDVEADTPSEEELTRDDPADEFDPDRVRNSNEPASQPSGATSEDREEDVTRGSRPPHFEVDEDESRLDEEVEGMGEEESLHASGSDDKTESPDDVAEPLDDVGIVLSDEYSGVPGPASGGVESHNGSGGDQEMTADGDSAPSPEGVDDDRGEAGDSGATSPLASAAVEDP